MIIILLVGRHSILPSKAACSPFQSMANMYPMMVPTIQSSMSDDMGGNTSVPPVRSMGPPHTSGNPDATVGAMDLLDLPSVQPPSKIQRKLIPQPTLVLPKLEEKMVELRKIVYFGLEADDVKWATDSCLQRYLRAEEGNVAKAHKRIIATIAWRKEQTTMCAPT